MSKQSRTLLIAVPILLLFWATRIHNINIFPPFIDETIHVYSVERIPTTSILFNAGLLRQFTIWLYALFAPLSSDNPMWVVRIATSFSVMVGVSAAMALSYSLKGSRALLSTAILLVFSNYHYFFERLALADPVSASFCTLAICLGYRLRLRLNYNDAILCGIALFLAFGAKTNALPYFAIPVFAGVLTYSHGRSLTKQLKWVGVALGTALGLSALLVIGLSLRGYDYLFSSIAFAINGSRATQLSTATELINLPQIAQKVSSRLEMVVAYSGIPYLILSAVSILFSLYRRQFYLLACLGVPALILSVSGVQESRYWIAPLATLVVINATFLSSIVSKSNVINSLLIVAFVVWGGVTFLPFFWQATNNPVSMTLDYEDRQEYVNSDASGFGLDEVIAVLRSNKPSKIFALLANCNGLRYRAWLNLSIECLPMGLDGQDIVENSRILADVETSNVFAVLEQSPYAPESASGDVIAITRRPTGLATLSVYRLDDDSD